MCGIAGRILNIPGRIGNDLVELMDAQEHRGADSTGFAIYGAPLDEGYILRGMGFDKSRLDADMDDFHTILKSHDADFLSDPSFVTDENEHYCVRMVISDPDDLARWIADADKICNRFEVQSCGRSLEIIKDIGSSEMVADKHTREPFDPSLAVSERVANAALEAGLICRPLGQAVVLCPPFTMTEALLDELFDKLRAALDAVFSELQH